MDELLQILKALAEENRLKIVVLLLEKDYCVGALAKRLGISKAAVSQHMKVLRENGIVKGEKRGYSTHYVVQKDKIQGISKELEEIAQREYIQPANNHPCQNDGGCCKKNSGNKNEAVAKEWD